jgi:hypothetical protein
MLIYYQGKQCQTITFLSRTREIESYNTCTENNKKCDTSEAIRLNNEATVRWYHKIRTQSRTEMEQRANSCLISITSADNMEAGINDYVNRVGDKRLYLPFYGK